MGRPNSIDFCEELASLLESRYGTTYSVYYLRDKLSHFRVGHARRKPFARPYAASLEIINTTLENRRRLWELHTTIPDTMDPEKIQYDLEICGVTMEEMMGIARYLATLPQQDNPNEGANDAEADVEEPIHSTTTTTTTTHHSHRLHFHHHMCSHFPPPTGVVVPSESTAAATN